MTNDNLSIHDASLSDSDPLEDKEILLEVVRGLVSKPECCQVKESTRNDCETMFLVEVDPCDVGAVLGKEGSTIRALKHIFRTIAYRDKRNAHIRVEGVPAVYRKNKPNSSSLSA